MTFDFKVADLGLAELGRHEIRLAEHEMPGLMALRAEFGDSKPLTGARVTGCFRADRSRPRERRPPVDPARPLWACGITHAGTPPR